MGDSSRALAPLEGGAEACGGDWPGPPARSPALTMASGESPPGGALVAGATAAALLQRPAAAASYDGLQGGGGVCQLRRGQAADGNSALGAPGGPRFGKR